MTPSSSSTSSSDPGVDPGADSSADPHTDPAARQARRLAAVVLSTVAALAILDLGANLLFARPADPRVHPTTLQRYFDYGRSIEGKLRYLVRATDEASGPLAPAGWVTTEWDQPTVASSPDGRLIAVYGQSMSHRVAHAIEALEPATTLRLLGGPGGPLGHTYELYRRDRHRHRAPVVVLGIVASGLRYLGALSTMGWGFEVPAPYTFPRWVMDGERLSSIQPVLDSLDDMRRALAEPAAWNELVEQMREHDLTFSPMLFESGISDHSAVLRCVKRAFGQIHQDRVTDRYWSAEGFKDTDGILTVARAILRQFAAEVRESGATPVVLLFHDRGYSDHLYQALSGVLLEERVPFVSTHEIAPADQQSTFVPDGHFQPEFDVEIARQVLALLEPAVGIESGSAGDGRR